MKHLRKFEKYTSLRRKNELIKESVLQVNDIYKVRTFIDIPQSLINAYVKKVKDTAGKNLRQFFGDVDIAEEIVKYINLNYLNVDKIPAGALMGDGQAQPQSQSDIEEPSAQVSTQDQVQTTQDQAQAPQVQVQSEPQTQAQTQNNFEEVKEEPTEKGTNEENPSEETEEKEEEKKPEEEGGTEELPG
jgi:hypothetical protein